MRLSSIQMSGFKSFVEPTRVIFDSPLIGVVGPNGCGKSNIVDAIRWVLGESSRNIRGGSLEDVIFDGSESRKRLDRASIEVVVDNALGRIGGEYANFSEIKIRREVSRDMERQSRYYINGSSVRRKDVSDLFQGTGLGRGNYAIIAQGMVQGLIEAKPEEMRKYIEEAAGISLYRERRRETENLIRRSEENLERVQDILKEHEQRLRHLGQQKEQADRLEVLQKEHRRFENEWVSLQLREQRNILGDREEEYASVEKKRMKQADELKVLNEDFDRKDKEFELSRKSVDEAVTHHQQLLAEVGSLDQAIRLQRERREQSLKERERVNVEIGELERSDAHVRKESQEYEAKCDQSSAELTRMRTDKGETEIRKAEQREAVRLLREQAASLQDQLGAVREERSDKKAHLRQYEDELQHLRTAGSVTEDSGDPCAGLRAQCESLHNAWQRCKERLEQNWQQIQDFRKQIGQHEEALAEAQAHRTQTQGRLTSLEALQQASLGSDPEEHAKALRGMRLVGERLMGHIEVESGWEFAVETVLGDGLGAFCVEELPKTVAEARVPGANPLMLLDHSSSETVASERMSLLSRVKSPFSLESQLSGVLAAETLEQAYAVHGALLPHQSVITQSGIWLGRDWMRLPAEEGRAEGTLERRREIDALSEKLRRSEPDEKRTQTRKQEAEINLQQQEERRLGLQEEYDQAYEAYAHGKARLQGAESQVQRLESLQRNVRESRSRQRQCERQIEALTQDRAGLEAAISEAEKRLRKNEEDAQQQAEQCNRLQMEVKTAQMAIDARQQQQIREQNMLKRHHLHREQLEQELAARQEDSGGDQRLAAKRKEQQAAKERLKEKREISDNLSAKRTELDRRRWAVNQESTELGKDLHDKDLRRRDIQGICEQLLGRLREQECDPEKILESLPKDARADQYDEKVQRILGRMEKMPPVNMAAAKEYEELQKQKDQEEERMLDVQKALEKLNEAIAKIDRETRERFRQTFSQVNENLKKVFPRIIGEGGEANLAMTEQNLLTTGVEVRARPPGKRYRSMHMLSGGEQAMVAVSVVLSLFMLNPAPFCILDEVDAPLSDDNLQRFCQIIAEMSEQIQFIVVTHNKITMEHVDQLIGVTMSEPGVSRLVSVNVAQAMEMVEQVETGAGHA